MTPRASVIVRSYNRLPALVELLELLLAQEHDSFEVVVVEQSTDKPAAEEAKIRALEASDPRLRVLRHPPLGGPRARNTGVKAARGEIILLIDDDDLPGDRRWIAHHLANYADPGCLGVTGRSLVPGGREPPYRDMAAAEKKVMSLSPLGWQRPYTRVAVKKQVDSLHGTNVSIRRSAIDRAGLWDECTPVEDELSFNYRLRKVMRPGEHLRFDPEATLVRRLDVPGGMGKRYVSTMRFTRRHFQFIHRIIGHYFPARYWLLQPAYMALLYRVVAEWVWDDSKAHDSLGKKLWTLAWLAPAMPGLWLYLQLEELRERLRRGPWPRQNPS